MPRKAKIKDEASLKWWNDKIQKIIPKKQDPLDYKKMNRRAIRNGSMVTFKYPNPKTDLKILRVFDARPLIFIFGMKGNKIYGINLHFTPKPMREIIISYIIKLNKINIKQDKRLELSWQMIKEFLHRQGLAHVITKTYLTNRIQDLQYIPPVDYKYVINLPSEKFVLDGQFSEDDLYKLIYSHAKKTKSSKNKRYGRK